MANTKEKILVAATGLFNEQGLVNVRLQHIADKAGISVGNLAYHYHDKKALVKAIFDNLASDLEPVLSENRRFPFLIDFDNQLSKYYYLFSVYSFYFLDLLELERAYPKIHRRRKEFIEQTIRQIRRWLSTNVEKKMIQPECWEGHYNAVAQTIWMIISFWKTQQVVRKETEKNGEEQFKKVVWGQVFPYFTESGKAEFDLLILPLLNYPLPDKD